MKSSQKSSRRFGFKRSSSDGNVVSPMPSMPDVSTPGSSENEKRLEQIQEQEHLDKEWKAPPWYDILASRHEPHPPPKSDAEAPVIPEAEASLWARLTFSWLTPLMRLGYSRPLEAEDLYRLDHNRQTQVLADAFMAHFDAQVNALEDRIVKLRTRVIKPPVYKRLSGKKLDKWYDEQIKKAQPSISKSLNHVLGKGFWLGGVFKLLSDSAQSTSPLLVKALIRFSAESYYASRLGTPLPAVGRGIGLAFGLLALLLFSSLCSQHYFYRSYSTGVFSRATLIAAVYNRAVQMTGKSRATHTNGKLISHISADVSRIDLFFQMGAHNLWTAPINLFLVLGILIGNIGASALIGFALLVLVAPFQAMAAKKMMGLRRESMRWTDKRTTLIQELLGGMRTLKFFAWEEPYLARLRSFRDEELKTIRKRLFIVSGTTAVAFSLPAIASVLSFVVYLHSRAIDPAVIFTAISLFSLLRLPLMMLPFSIGLLTDYLTAVQRLVPVLTAERRTHELQISLGNDDCAVKVTNASFEWEAAPPRSEEIKKKVIVDAAKSNGKIVKRPFLTRLLRRKAPKVNHIPESHEPSTSEPLNLELTKIATREAALEPESLNASLPEPEHLFSLPDIQLDIPKGSLVAIVGPVGSGKSSILQALIGEMRCTAGSVEFSGSVGYCPQMAWIQNASLQDNILFGQPWNSDRYQRALEASALQQDIAILPAGDQTEIGERGINLSGGQRQRVSIARLIYANKDIVLLDDPLSAVDAHVGRHIFDEAICSALAGKTRLLVTHALHFLSRADLIITIAGGKICERGKFADLVANDGVFSKMMAEFGSEDTEEKTKVEKKTEVDEIAPLKQGIGAKDLMSKEERVTGAVSGTIWKQYFIACRGYITVPILLTAVAWMTGASVMTSYWIVYWQEDKFQQSRSFYMGLYAMFAIALTMGIFMVGATFAVIAFVSARAIFRAALQRVFFAPMSFIDTTPLGRIAARLSKDVEVLDNNLSESFRMATITLANIVGAIVLTAIVEPYFLVGMFVIALLYIYASLFYRASARELKRLDNILRSSLYGHFSESLAGLATIRAYGELPRFLKEHASFMDLENRAYFLTIVNQRWLGLRLDSLGTLMTFVVAVIAVSGRKTISPSQIGLILSYVLQISGSFGWFVRQASDCENNMNSVERLLYYANDLEQEAPHTNEATQPREDWPQQGAIQLRNVVMSYRPGLPAVLRDITLDIKGGESIGIVGRTGAGKSSILSVLFRMVELQQGSILIDGVDIATLGLNVLRQNLALVPQDPLLFNGTLRSNLDPFGAVDDATLYSALQRAYLVEQVQESGHGIKTDVHGRFTLDTVIDDEGSNLSVGERSLVSLARALIRDSKIIVLDEATASVDFETDAKLQMTIRREFKDKTLLCIAHRLRTIISYDRVLVLSAGQVEEFDTPLALFDRNGQFRSMCNGSNISREDILKHSLSDQ